MVTRSFIWHRMDRWMRRIKNLMMLIDINVFMRNMKIYGETLKNTI